MSHKISSGSRTGPERSAVDLSKLLGYYLACVEEEDRRSLQLSADPKYRQFVTPPGQPALPITKNDPGLITKISPSRIGLPLSEINTGLLTETDRPPRLIPSP